MAGVAQLASEGVGLAVVAHADLPFATGLAALGEPGTVTLVPDRRRDGTNVAVVPTGAGFSFAYGQGSFERHRAEAARLGLPCQIVYDRRLAIDIDLPEDLARSRTWQPDRMDCNLPLPARALAVGAHPDDVEFGCGATLAKWAAQGCEIFHLICTDGSKGTWDPATDPAELVVTRRNEQQAASIALGGRGEVVFLGWPDGELESGLRQRFEVASAIRKLRPDVVFGHDPWKRYRLHPDHRNAGFLVTDGIVAARDPLFSRSSATRRTARRPCSCSRRTSRTISRT